MTLEELKRMGKDDPEDTLILVIDPPIAIKHGNYPVHATAVGKDGKWVRIREWSNRWVPASQCVLDDQPGGVP